MKTMDKRQMLKTEKGKANKDREEQGEQKL